MFPFLSVLACVIGTLTLMIASLALGNLVESHSASRIDEYDRRQEDNRKARDEVAQLKRLISEAQDLQDKLRNAREKLKHLEQLLKRTKEQEQLKTKSLAEVRDLQRQISKMERELKRLNKRIEERRMHCQELEKEADDSKGKSRIVLQPGGSGRGLTPHFVECTGDSLVIYSDFYSGSRRIDHTDDKNFKKFSEFLNKVKSKESTTVIFLIRADGVGIYDDAFSVAEKLSVRNGKLPLPGQGKIDFSLFRHL